MPDKVEHLHKALVNHYDNYDDSSRDTLRDYTIGSHNLNSFLFKRQNSSFKPTESQNKVYGEKINFMDDALKRHKTPHKLTVYSGMKYDPRTAIDKNNVVLHPSYLSTSLDKHQALDFANSGDYKGDNSHRHIMKINVPKGHPGAYVEHLTHNEGEKEFILPRGTKLKYRGTQSHEGFGDQQGDYTLHEHAMDIVK